MYETSDVPTSDIRATLSRIRRMGGHICQSSPIADGYRVTVFWPADEAAYRGTHVA